MWRCFLTGVREKIWQPRLATIFTSATFLYRGSLAATDTSRRAAVYLLPIEAGLPKQLPVVYTHLGHLIRLL